MTTNRRRIRLVLALTCLLTSTVLSGSGCAPPPPNLTPHAQAAWRGTQVITVLDAFRDGAISLNAQSPLTLDEATTRRLVLWHRTCVEVVHAYPSGAVPMVRTGLRELLKDLPAPTRELLRPYVQLVFAVLGEE